MTEYTQQVQGPWTEADTTAFAHALGAFRDSLPPRQRDILTAIVATSAKAVGEDPRGHDDAQGYFYNWFFGALEQLTKNLSGVPAWPEGTTVYYPQD